MKLAETFLPRLSGWRPTGDGRHSWSEAFADLGWTVRVATDKNDTLSALVWELALERTAEAPADLTLRSWADGAAARVSGLMEDLKVLEVDGAAGEALLRSDDPSRKGSEAFYYEVRLSGLSNATVRRFKADTAAGTRREQVAFAVTHEVLAKLAGDLAG